jgi:DNA-binding TFAR19-related protein (PDSD5 family)
MKDNEEEKLLQIKSLALQIFEPEAYTRFMTLLQYNPEKAAKAFEFAVQFYNKKQKKIKDEELKSLLAYLSPEKRETSIQIKRK